MYVELVIFSNFVTFKSRSVFSFLITPPEGYNYPLLGSVTFQFQSD